VQMRVIINHNSCLSK